MNSTPSGAPNPPPSSFVLGLLILSAFWIVARPLAGQFNPYSPENGFANAIVALFGLCAGAAAWSARPRILFPERLTLALLLYFGVTTWGLLRSPNFGQGVALFGEALSYIVLLGGGFVLARLAPGSSTLLTRAVLAAVATQALAAVWQHFVDLPHLWSSVRSGELSIPEELASTAGQYRLFGTDVFGSFGNPNSLAAYLLVGLGLLAGLVIAHREAKEDALDSNAIIGTAPQRRTLRLAGFIATAALLLAALLWTNSKGAWVAGAALLWFALQHALLLRRPAWRKPLLALSVCGLLAMSAVLALGMLEALPMPDSLRIRFDYWRAGAGMVAAQPLDGVGLGGFAEHYSFYKLPLGTETRDAHNDYLHFWAELGILGVLMYLALWSVLLRGPQPPERNHEPARARVLEISGLTAFVLMYFGFQVLNSSAILALLAGQTDGPTFSGLTLTLLMPLLYSLVFANTRSLTAAGAWRGFGCAAGAILIHQMVDFDFKAPALLGSLFLLGGALLGDRTEPDLHADAPLQKASPALLPCFALVLLPLGVWFPFVSGVARKNAVALEEELRSVASKDHKLQRQERRLLVGALVEARQRAAASTPFDAQAWLEYAEALRMQLRDTRDPALRRTIVDALQRAIALRPVASAPRIQYANYQMDSLERGSALELGTARLEMAAQAFASAALRYPLHPGIRIWEGDARLLQGDLDAAVAAYNKAFAIDRRILDANVRLSACFTDPMAGAFPRHGLDTEVLMTVLHNLQESGYAPHVQRGLQLRRLLALAGAIRSIERINHAEERAAVPKLRAELARAAQSLPGFYSDSGDRAHAALLAAMSYQLSAAPGSAEAWDRARDLQKKALNGTVPRLFNMLESHFGRNEKRAGDSTGQ